MQVWNICMQHVVKAACLVLYTIDLLWMRSCLLFMCMSYKWSLLPRVRGWESL
uniref:Uncharacterized protein n=1 Tax=Arundo donax TaxID=35708 RepID=A0A0A9FW90_ARUDO